MRYLQYLGKILLVFLGAFSSTMNGQSMCDLKFFKLDRLNGRVVSDGPRGLEPIEGALVELKTTGKKETTVETLKTDRLGVFDFPRIKNGKYVVFVSNKAARFFDFYFVVEKTSKADPRTRADLIVRLGVSPIEPCGGGSVTLEKTVKN